MKTVLVTLLGVLCAFPVAVLAHGNHSETPQVKRIETATYASRVSITEEDGMRIIISNGIPNHRTGRFPSTGNPHAISPQKYEFKVRLNPNIVGNTHRVTNQKMFGVALNGVPFDPGTAEYWKKDRNSGWVKEGIINGKRMLGIDMNNAHVQPNGAYHYHSIPTALVKEDLTHVGYAADGHKIYVSKDGAYKPGFRLRRGNRSQNSPGGAYDGTYTQDFQFVVGHGDLDQCNGTRLNGEYVYFLTEEFPFVPRCWKGFPHESFTKEPPEEGRSGPDANRGDRRGPPSRGNRPPPARGF